MLLNKLKLTFSIIKEKWHKIVTPPDVYAREKGVTIGEDNFLPDKNCWPAEAYLITIGNHCQITSGVRFFTHGGGQAVRQQIPNFDTFGKIVIGDWVYIGNNSLIMPGVAIGNNVLVAAGSVVTKSIPSRMVVGGNPARILCTIDEYLERNTQYNTGTKGLSYEEKKNILLELDEAFFIKKDYMKRNNNEKTIR